jgi:RNase P/RNase MRP subunit POP5
VTYYFIFHVLHWSVVKRGEFGRAIAQAVSRWLLTAAVRDSSPGLVMWDFVVEKVTLGQVFSEYFSFPCQSSFHKLLQKSFSSIIWGLYNRPEVAAVPRDLAEPRDLSST